MTEDHGPWLRTASNGKIFIEQPEHSIFTLEDIATGLANTPRFGGQLPRPVFYSVAEHSLFVLRITLDNIRTMPIDDDVRMSILRQALLHDAPEAFYCDMPHPLKNLLPDYRQHYARLEAVIFTRAGLPSLLSEIVLAADQLAFRLETNQIVKAYDDFQHEPLQEGDKIYDPQAPRMSPHMAITEFMKNSARLGIKL